MSYPETTNDYMEEYQAMTDRIHQDEDAKCDLTRLKAKTLIEMFLQEDRRTRDEAAKMVPVDMKRHEKLRNEITRRMHDPFGRAKAIRSGDVAVPEYEELTGFIQQVQPTWLPGIIEQCVASAIVGNVFKDGGMVEFVQKSIDRFNQPGHGVLR